MSKDIRWSSGLRMTLMLVATVNVAHANFPQPYCSWHTSKVAAITHVDFAGLVHESGAGGSQPALENFTPITGAVVAGATPMINIGAEFGGGFPPWPIRVAVFADWNLDGDFDDADERIDLGWLQGSGTSGSQSGPLHVPMYVIDSSTRMRVVAAGMSSGNPPACGNADTGQAEDYTLQIRAEILFVDGFDH